MNFRNARPNKANTAFRYSRHDTSDAVMKFPACVFDWFD